MCWNCYSNRIDIHSTSQPTNQPKKNKWRKIHSCAICMANTCECSIDKSCVHFLCRSLPVLFFFLCVSLKYWTLELISCWNQKCNALNEHFCDTIRAEKKESLICWDCVGYSTRCPTVQFAEKRVRNVNNTHLGKERSIPSSSSLNTDSFSVNQTFHWFGSIFILNTASSRR